MKRFLVFLAVIIAIFGAPSFAASPENYKVETVAEGLIIPWSLAILPNGDMLITELGGTLRLVKNGKLVKRPIGGVPKVFRQSQGGLMDIILHPKFKHNRLVYISYASKLNGKNKDKNATHVMRAKLQGNNLTEQKVIFVAKAAKTTPAHYGGRMAFTLDGKLLLTLGDGFNYREEAQNKQNHFGSIVRLNDDGSVAKGNPFIGNKEGDDAIWTFGHRNSQAILVDSKGRVFSNEHGPLGGDEINLIEKGKNYGWPAITYGLDYSGATISPWTKKKGMVQPLYQWTPSIGPSGMAIYEGQLFPKWRGNLFVTSLVFGRVERFPLRGNKIVASEKEILFEDLDVRLRDIRIGRDGAIYLLAETTGRLLKITPK